MKIFSKFSSRHDLNANSDSKCTIRLLDDNESLTYEFSNSTTGQNVLDFVAQKLDILEKDYFGLRSMEENKQRSWIDPVKLLVKQLKNVSQPYILCFRVRFYPPRPELLQEEITKYYLFCQLRRDLLHGRLFINQNDGPLLAAYILQSEIGDYDPSEMGLGYVSQYKLLMKQTSKLEEKIAEIHKNLAGQVPSEAEMNFLQKVATLDTYGIDPYPVKDQKGTHMYIGINHSGIMTFQGNSKIHHLKWEQIKRIEFDGKVFVIHLLIDQKKLVIGFKCPTQSSCKHIWHTAIEQRDFFHLQSSNEAKIHRSGGGIFSRSSKYRYSGRVEKELNDDIASRATSPKENKFSPISRNLSFKDREFPRSKGGSYFSHKAKPLMCIKPKVYASDSANYSTNGNVGIPKISNGSAMELNKSPNETVDSSNTNSLPYTKKFLPGLPDLNSPSTTKSAPSRPPPPASSIDYIDTPKKAEKTSKQTTVYHSSLFHHHYTFTGPSLKTPLKLARPLIKNYRKPFIKAFSLNENSSITTASSSLSNDRKLPSSGNKVGNCLTPPTTTTTILPANAIATGEDESFDTNVIPYQTYIETPPANVSHHPTKHSEHTSDKGSHSFLVGTESAKSNRPPARPPPLKDLQRSATLGKYYRQDESKTSSDKNDIFNFTNLREKQNLLTNFTPFDDKRLVSNVEEGERMVNFTDDELLDQANKEILRLQEDKRNHLSGPNAKLNLSSHLNVVSLSTPNITKDYHPILTDPVSLVNKAHDFTTMPVREASKFLGRLSPAFAEKSGPLLETIDNAFKNVSFVRHRPPQHNVAFAKKLIETASDNASPMSGEQRLNSTFVYKEPSILSKLTLLLLLLILLGLALILLMESNNPNARQLFKLYPALLKFKKETYSPVSRDLRRYWENLCEKRKY